MFDGRSVIRVYRPAGLTRLSATVVGLSLCISRITLASNQGSAGPNIAASVAGAGTAEEVHHLRDLTGDRLDMLLAVCRDCHLELEAKKRGSWPPLLTKCSRTR